jgi:hypothetical protein
MNTPTPRTDTATYPADCLGTTLVTNRDHARTLERELAAERARLRQVALDSCKSAQIRPLLWYPKGYVINPNDLGKINEQQVDACFAAIDAAMREDAK